MIVQALGRPVVDALPPHAAPAAEVARGLGIATSSAVSRATRPPLACRRRPEPARVAFPSALPRHRRPAARRSARGAPARGGGRLVRHRRGDRGGRDRRDRRAERAARLHPGGERRARGDRARSGRGGASGGRARRTPAADTRRGRRAGGRRSPARGRPRPSRRPRRRLRGPRSGRVRAHRRVAPRLEDGRAGAGGSASRRALLARVCGNGRHAGARSGGRRRHRARDRDGSALRRSSRPRSRRPPRSSASSAISPRSWRCSASG